MKYALIIGNDRYNDSKLARLKTPAADARALANALNDQNIGFFDSVLPLINKTESQVSRAISAFLANKKPEDLVLVYFSGHGVLDSRGRLFLALKDTQIGLLKSTAIPAAFIADEMDSCRSKRQILVLDCCNSGAFERGTKGEQKAVTEATFEGNGYGRVVLTASDSTQFALEGEQVIQTELSLFTHFLLKGLRTGEADANNDGHISLDEWYDYAYTQVLTTTSRQTPNKWSYRQQGDLVIAKNPQYELMKREAAERAAREKIKQETEAKAEREKAEREAAEKIRKEIIEREAARDEAERRFAELMAVEKARREAEQKSARRAEFASLFSKRISFTRIVVFAGIIFSLFLIGSWAKPKIFPSVPVIDATATLTKPPESPNPPASSTPEILNSSMLSLTPAISNTPALPDERSFEIEHLETITVENLPELNQLNSFTYDGNFLALSPSGKIMLTDAGLIYDLETQQAVCDVSQSKIDQQQGSEFALSDKYAIVFDDSTIQAWDFQECTSKTISVPSIQSVVDVAIAPNDINILIQAINDEWRHVLVDWNLAQSKQTKRITLGSAMSDMIFAPDGVTFAASTGGGFAQIYTFSDFASGSKFAASNLWANIISYRPDKDILITSDEYPTTNTNIRVWKISTGKSIYKVSDATELSTGRLGLSPDGKMYAASKEKTLSFWNIDTDTEFYKLDVEKLVFGSIFSDNQKVLLILLDGNRMAIYGVNPELGSDS